MNARTASNAGMGARSVARRLAMQALYRWQLNRSSWQDLVAEFATAEDMTRADGEYFRALIEGICRDHESLDGALAAWMDRTPVGLDPVEHALLLIACYELKSRLDVPWRVVIDEAVGLARRFGATDGHRFVNAVLDRAARELRPHEH